MRPKRTIKFLFLAIIFVSSLWIVLPLFVADDISSIKINIARTSLEKKDIEFGNGENVESEAIKNAPGLNKLPLDAPMKDQNVPIDKRFDIEERKPEVPPRNYSLNTDVRHDFRDHASQSAMIKEAMLTINHEQRILNLERFPRRSEDSIVILVMVHDRLEYLEYLIDSLRKAADIRDALLIFSHDYYSEDINRVVRKVDFCQTMQIFYPYSLQVYQNEFPGIDPKDCPRDITRERAKELKCNNWEHPDSYGHYREVRYVMTKHHWFWKLQYVFSGLEATKHHNGLVLLLEEDHYVGPDFYPMLKKMYQLKKDECPECDILTLGNYDKNFVYKDRNDKVDSLTWQSSKHNMGMSLDRKTWEKLQPCVQVFCTYDDYNWDWTMNYISHKCLQKDLQAMVFKSPRIFHIGECGIHHKGKGKCSAEDLVSRIDGTLQTNAQYLHPSRLVLTPKTRPLKVRLPKPNGGWGDVRDHTLCMAYGKQAKAL